MPPEYSFLRATPFEVQNPLSWPRISVLAGHLDVPGVGLVRIVHPVYLLAWRLIECDEGRVAYCITKNSTSPASYCSLTGHEDWDAFWMLAQSPHLIGVEVALAARTPDGELQPLVARGGSQMLVAVMRHALFPHSDDPDHAATLTSRAGAIEIEFDRVPSPSSAATRLRRDLPPGWERHPEHQLDAFAREQEMLQVPDPPCTTCGGPLETMPCGWCGAGRGVSSL
jgi:hypothetical protein